MNVEYAKNLPASWARFTRFFAALGDPYRQKIVLMFGPNEELCVNEIASQFNLSRPAISHHLKVLRDADLLLSEKRGKEVYYRVNYAYYSDVLKQIHEFVLSPVQDTEEKDTEGMKTASLRVSAGGQ